MNDRMLTKAVGRVPNTANFFAERSRRLGKQFLPCVPAARSVTMPFIEWRRN